MHSKIVFLAGALPEGRVFGLDIQTVISAGIMLLNGIILAVALGVLLYKPVKEFMNKRSKRIQSGIEDADSTMAKANELIAQYDVKIKEIDKERIEILENAREKASEESKAILQGAREEAVEIKKRSQESITEEKRRLQDETRIHIIELASLMAEKYISNNIDDETQNRIFEETLAEMEESQWQN